MQHHLFYCALREIHFCSCPLFMFSQAVCYITCHKERQTFRTLNVGTFGQAHRGNILNSKVTY